MYVAGSPEAAHFSAELETVVREAGWPAGRKLGASMTADTVSGLFVMIRDLGKETPQCDAANRLIPALRKSGFTTYGVQGPETPTDEIELLVGFKPDAAP